MKKICTCMVLSGAAVGMIVGASATLLTVMLTKKHHNAHCARK